MITGKNADNVYDSCLINGLVKELESPDENRVETLMKNAKAMMSSADIIVKSVNKSSSEWTSVFVLYYDALRMFSDALLETGKVEVADERGILAAISVRHPELELDWDFLEGMRAKANSVMHGKLSLSHDDWKALELQMKLYISAIRKELENKL